MSNIKQQMPLAVMDTLSDVKRSAEGTEGLLNILCDALDINVYEGKGYATAVSAIHTHSQHHLELLRALETKLKELQVNIEV